ncbi:isoprenoid synthase domain-containing protein [Zychaea mexicana]|uniref:isoprenoid synthase domain-containing protein n=1 Tax=Zychaea mexicana TaxID=64656 RepID=UPI0022FEC429|nr:isoprenoid synthase domain-containing protein [Zychaea mexicana]KAI9482629.1 isoprenoid synthase domain-containing protein [Zychaea mexicana]
MTLLRPFIRHARQIHTCHRRLAQKPAAVSVAAAAAAALTHGPLGKGIDTFRSTFGSKPLTAPFTGQAETYEQALNEAQGLVVDESAGDSDGKQRMLFDPAKLVGPDLWELKGNISKLLGSGHPFLNTMMTHFLCDDGQPVRPLLVLLTAQASTGQVIDTQRRLAEITHMIHAASLLHDDVLETESGGSLGNKMAILAGDFLLARASLALAYLRNAECVELMATCIAHLVEGEFMDLVKKQPRTDIDYYLDQTEMKTVSLIAQSCKGSAVLGNASTDDAKHAYEFGRHFGIAYQLVEDVLDFSAKSSSGTFRAGAPVVFASESVPGLLPMIERRFSQPEDHEKARLYVYQSGGLKKTLALAESHCQRAIDAISQLPPSDARSALVQLSSNLIRRKN